MSEEGSGVCVAPHEFEPLRWWDRFTLFGSGRCKYCMASDLMHWDVVHWGHWAPARPWGDKSKAQRGVLKRRQDVRKIQSTETPTEGKET